MKRRVAVLASSSSSSNYSDDDDDAGLVADEPASKQSPSAAGSSGDEAGQVTARSRRVLPSSSESEDEAEKSPAGVGSSEDEVLPAIKGRAIIVSPPTDGKGLRGSGAGLCSNTIVTPCRSVGNFTRVHSSYCRDRLQQEVEYAGYDSFLDDGSESGGDMSEDDSSEEDGSTASESDGSEGSNSGRNADPSTPVYRSTRSARPGRAKRTARSKALKQLVAQRTHSHGTPVETSQQSSRTVSSVEKSAAPSQDGRRGTEVAGKAKVRVVRQHQRQGKRKKQPPPSSSSSSSSEAMPLASQRRALPGQRKRSKVITSSEESGDEDDSETLSPLAPRRISARAQELQDRRKSQQHERFAKLIDARSQKPPPSKEKPIVVVEDESASRAGPSQPNQTDNDGTADVVEDCSLPANAGSAAGSADVPNLQDTGQQVHGAVFGAFPSQPVSSREAIGNLASQRAPARTSLDDIIDLEDDLVSNDVHDVIASNGSDEDFDRAVWDSPLVSGKLADSDKDQLTIASQVTKDFLEGLSRQDRHALERALKKGQKQIRHGRIIIIGPGRSGKSALIRSMLNKPFQHTNSTIGIEVGKVRCTTNAQAETLRFEEQNEMFLQKVLMAYDAILDIIKQEKRTSPLPGSPEHPHASAGQSLADDTSQAQEGPPLCAGSESILSSDCTSSEEIQCTKAVLKSFIDKLRSHDALKDGILEAFWHFDIWDFAGQQPFEALQQMFLSSARCAYLIVFDATKLLNGTYHDEFTDSSGESHEGDREGCSYFRAFESWLHIVQQVVGDDVDVPVYAVGTHIDEFDAEVRQKELAKVEDRIWKVAEKRAYYQNLRKVFFVDNTKSGLEQEDPEIGVLRQELITSMESQCSLPIPISWMPFAPVLDAITQKLKVRVLPLDRVQQIAREACQDEDVDVDGLLSYHHHLGQIIHCRCSSEDSSHPGSLPQAPVIIDTDWLVQAAAILFTPEPLKMRSPRFRKEYKLLFDEGILLDCLAIHRWSKSELTQDLAENADLRQVVLTLLAQFDLLYSSSVEDVPASAPDSRYIVPVLVNRPANLQCSLRYHARTPSYYIVCGEHQLFPQVLFWCLLVRLMKEFNTGTRVLLFKNKARLMAPSLLWVEMSLFDSGICLTIELEKGDAKKLAKASHQVLNQLSRCLLALRSVSLRHVELFQAVRCECSSGDLPCREHQMERCANINCFHFARLPLCTDPKYSSVEPVFRCPLDALPLAVVDNQPEMRRYWLPDGSIVGITPEQSRGPAPRDFWEPSRLPPVEKQTGAAQSLDMPRSRKDNPWDSSPYRINYPKLIRLMHPTEVKIKCKSLSLMTWCDEEEVDNGTTRSDKNAQILKVMEVSARKFGQFREILRTIHDCREVAIELDAVGPERHTDKDCLRAKDILETSDR